MKKGDSFLSAILRLLFLSSFFFVGLFLDVDVDVVGDDIVIHAAM